MGGEGAPKDTLDAADLGREAADASARAHEHGWQLALKPPESNNDSERKNVRSVAEQKCRSAALANNAINLMEARLVQAPFPRFEIT